MTVSGDTECEEFGVFKDGLEVSGINWFEVSLFPLAPKLTLPAFL